MNNNLIISLAKVNKLPQEDIHLLLAWSELGFSEHIAIAKESFKEQVEWAIETIKRFRKQYYEYRKESASHNFSFIEFLGFELSKSRVWVKDIQNIMEGYNGNEGIEGN